MLCVTSKSNIHLAIILGIQHTFVLSDVSLVFLFLSVSYFTAVTTPRADVNTVLDMIFKVEFVEFLLAPVAFHRGMLVARHVSLEIASISADFTAPGADEADAKAFGEGGILQIESIQMVAVAESRHKIIKRDSRHVNVSVGDLELWRLGLRHTVGADGEEEAAFEVAGVPTEAVRHPQARLPDVSAHLIEN
jgi:hypothetical protein